MAKPGSYCSLVLPDLHIPDHCSVSLAVVLAVYRKLRPKEVVILGDWLDCHAFSSHPRKSLSDAEIQLFHSSEVSALFKILEVFSKSRVIYIEGNHEHRVERWALSSPTNRSVYPLVSPQHLVTKEFRNVQWIPYVDHGLPHYKIAPDLWAVHGWSHSRHAAAAHLNKSTGFSIVYGHTHRLQVDSRRDLSTGAVTKAWSPGCLAKPQPIYRHSNPTEWTHGFSLVYQSERTRRWTDYNVTIDRGGCVLPDGREVKAS